MSRSPRVKYLGYTSNGHLFLSTFCAGGGGSVTFGVFAVPPPPSLIVLLNDFLLLWHDVTRVVMTSRECWAGDTGGDAWSARLSEV